MSLGFPIVEVDRAPRANDGDRTRLEILVIGSGGSA